MTTRTTGRVVGALILSAFFLYGGGSFLVASSSSSASPLPPNAAAPVQLSAGVVLLLLNSLAVVVVGALAFEVLKQRHPRTARVYLATRVVEGVLLALAPMGLLVLTLVTRVDGGASVATGSGLEGLARTAVDNTETAYWVAMTALGAGSIFFCLALLRSALLPRLLAAWGIVGYAIFALGGLLEIAGYGFGLALSVPGGLFEVAAGFFLVVKGFRSAPPVAADAEAVGPSGHHATRERRSRVPLAAIKE